MFLYYLFFSLSIAPSTYMAGFHSYEFYLIPIFIVSWTNTSIFLVEDNTLGSHYEYCYWATVCYIFNKY